MSDFIIPKNRDYEFTLNIKEADTFIAQDLTEMVSADMWFMSKTLSPEQYVAENGSNSISGTIKDAQNGVLHFTIPQTFSSNMTVKSGDEVDGFYPKVTYSAHISIKFTDTSSTDDIYAIIEDVYVVEAS